MKNKAGKINCANSATIGQFKSYFNDNKKPQTNARKNADLRTAISNFVAFINN
jgi:hypothetical protein